MTEPIDAFAPNTQAASEEPLVPAHLPDIGLAILPRGKKQDLGETYPDGASLWDGVGGYDNSHIAASLAITAFRPVFKGNSPTADSFIATTNTTARTLFSTIETQGEQAVGTVVGGVIRFSKDIDEAYICANGNVRFIAIEKDAQGKRTVHYITQDQTIPFELFGKTPDDEPTTHVYETLTEALRHVTGTTYDNFQKQFDEAWRRLPTYSQFAYGKYIRQMQDKLHVPHEEKNYLEITLRDFLSLRHVLGNTDTMQVKTHPITDATEMVLGLTDGMEALTEEDILKLADLYPDASAQEFAEILVSSVGFVTDKLRKNADDCSAVVIKPAKNHTS